MALGIMDYFECVDLYVHVSLTHTSSVTERFYRITGWN